MALQPMQDCLIVRPEMDKHELFVLLKQNKTGSGVVIAAGPDAKEVTVGDKILFGDFVGMDLRWEGEDLLVMREEHIMGVYENE